MPSASKSTTLYSSGGYAYTLSSSFVETETSTADNTSTVSCTAQLIPTSYYWSTGYQSTLAIYWHDNRENTDKLVSSITFAGIGAGETKTATGTTTVYHKDDGTLSGYAYAYFTKGQTTSAFAPNNGGVATDLTALTNIDRYPILITATDFNDESNPTITYTTNVGFQNATTYAGISLDGTTDNIPYRQVRISDGTYTFDNLTEAQRNILRSATPNSNDLDVYFILKTVIGNDTYYSTPLKRKMSIVNANPTVSYIVTETNSKVVSLLGTNNANTLIRLASTLSIVTTFSTKKYSTAKKINLREGTSDNVIQTYTTPNPTSPKTSTLSITGYPNSGKFIITLTDSRENPTIKTDNQRTVLDYTPVKILNYSFKRYSPTSSNIILNAEFTYLSGIGNYANVPKVSWKLDNGSYAVIPSTNYSIDATHNKLTISNYVLTNALNYKLNGNFSIKIEDLLTEAEDSGINGHVLAGIPTFDYGATDVQVNGDLFIADEDGDDAVNVLEEINAIKPKFALGFVGTITQFFTNWQQTPIKISDIYTNDSSMFTLDTSNGHNRIVIGSGVSLVEVSGLVSWNNNPTNGEFDATIMLNGDRIRKNNVVLAHTFNSQNTVGSLNHNTLPITPVEVQEGDYFEICSGGAVNDNVTIMEANLYIKKIG